MPQNKPIEELKGEALTVLVQWYGADKAAAADKSSPQKQRAEYKCRKNLRTAADNLVQVRHD